MKLAKVTNHGSTIEYTKYQGWDDGANTPDPERNQLFREFRKDLLARIEDQLSDELTTYGIKVVEDDDFYLALERKVEFVLSDEFLTALYEHTGLSDREKDYLLAIMEASLEDKLTDEEKDRLKDFKKRYKATLDADGNGTMKLNNEIVKVYSRTNGDVASSDAFTGDLSLHMRKFLKISGAKDREAVLQHEFGHRKLHTVDMRGGVVDRKRIDDELRKQIRDELTSMVKRNNQSDTSEFIKKLKYYTGLHLREEDIKMQKSGLIVKRKEFRDKLKHLVTPNSHANLLEFEADQYAANKVGVKQLIHAFQTMDALDNEFDEIDVDEKLSELEKTKNYKKASEKEKKRLKQFVADNVNSSPDLKHQIHEMETKVRENALNKKDIDPSVRKSFTD